MNQTLSLYRLQQTDSQIGRAQARLQAIQKILENDDMLRQAETQAEVAEKNIKEAKRALHQAEDAVRAQRIKIEQTESSLYGGNVHIPKELQDLQNDVAALKRYLVTLEDRQLEAMLASDDAETAQRTAQATLQTAQSQSNEQHRSLYQEQADIQKTVTKLETERQVIANAIPGNLIAEYNQLRQTRGGVAVAIVSENACAACGSGLTPAEQQAARSAAQMAHCPSCGRILYGG
jgi:predicted  nucleic acid-binding Zn-ribbon protein